MVTVKARKGRRVKAYNPPVRPCTISETAPVAESITISEEPTVSSEETARNEESIVQRSSNTAGDSMIEEDHASSTDSHMEEQSESDEYPENAWHPSSGINFWRDLVQFRKPAHCKANMYGLDSTGCDEITEEEQGFGIDTYEMIPSGSGLHSRRELKRDRFGELMCTNEEGLNSDRKDFEPMSGGSTSLSTPSLLTLPFEIRGIVYKHVFAEAAYTFHGPGRSYCRGYVLSMTCMRDSYPLDWLIELSDSFGFRLTCKQIFDETSTIVPIVSKLILNWTTCYGVERLPQLPDPAPQWKESIRRLELAHCVEVRLVIEVFQNLEELVYIGGEVDTGYASLHQEMAEKIALRSKMFKRLRRSKPGPNPSGCKISFRLTLNCREQGHNCTEIWTIRFDDALPPRCLEYALVDMNGKRCSAACQASHEKPFFSGAVSISCV